MEVHLDQSVSDKVSEATAVEVAVSVHVVFAIVDLRELQTSVVMEIFPMEILVCTEHLHRWKKESNTIQGTFEVIFSSTFN